MKSTITLLTGIPRSGTTLCCKLINRSAHAVALHEPIDPRKVVSTTAESALQAIQEQITILQKKLQKGESFEHGDKHKLILDNPVSQSNFLSNGKRALGSKRGMITLPPVSSSAKIFIKQNAMFTSLVAELAAKFSVVEIVRNPIDVMTSWMTVDLPVNKGRIPGGERFDPSLKATLDAITPVIDRQIVIYHWFVEQYIKSGVPILKYEDIVESKGKALFDVCSVPANIDPKLTHRHAHRPELKSTLSYVADSLDYELISPFYSSRDVNYSLTQTTLNYGCD